MFLSSVSQKRFLPLLSILSSELGAWKVKYADVLQEGRVGPRDAQDKVKLAEQNLVRAQRNLEAGDSDEALAKAENAIVNAADALLARAGYRLRGKTGSHRARFKFPDLPREFRDLRSRLIRGGARIPQRGAERRE